MHNNHKQNLINFQNRRDVRDIVAVSNHHFHNPQLKEQAINAVECFVHAANNGIPRVMHDYHKQAVTIKNLDRAEYAVDTGRGFGHGTKLFSILEKRPVSPSVVESPQFKWIVRGINGGYEAIPDFALKNLTSFKQHGCIFDNLAVAAPYQTNYLGRGFVFNQESKRTLLETYSLGRSLIKTLGRNSVKASKTVTSLTSKALQSMAAKADSLASRPKEFIRDPVLLGCFGDAPCFLVEIARWE